MPTIKITEKDYSNLSSEYTNFSVVIPGIYAANSALGGAEDITTITDENKIYECSGLADFEEKIGIVAPKELTLLDGSGEARKYFHYGNQMAYECIKAGYTVLFIALAKETTDSVAGTDSTILTELEKADTYEALKDRSAYDFRYIVNGLLSENTEANKLIAQIADFRGDCTALIDLNEKTYMGQSTQSKRIDALVTAANGCGVNDSVLSLNGIDFIEPKYTAIFAPSFCYTKESMPAYNKYGNNKFPAVMHYLLCAAYARTNGNYDEWFASAGEVRGICKYNIDSTSIKLGETAMNCLEPRMLPEDGKLKRAVNIIVTHRNNHYLWGNRTAHKLIDKDSGGDLVYSHFLNIRQLCSTLKKQIYITCKHLTFDPNSDVLWINFCDSVRPVLEKMKGNQGIVDYKFVRVATSKKATLKAKVRIIPIEAVEDFDIEVSLEDTFGELSTAINE